MKNNVNINSENQSGGINGHNVTINNYHKSTNGIGSLSFIFKNKAVTATLIIGLLATVGYRAKTSFWPDRITDKDSFYTFVGEYLQSSGDMNTDVRDYFTDNISKFYLRTNISREQVNDIRKKTDYIDTHLNIDKNSITLRKAGDINYWRFTGGFTCYRPSKNMYEKCNVEMEYGLDPDNKIASIEQINCWGLSYTKEKPE